MTYGLADVLALVTDSTAAADAMAEALRGSRSFSDVMRHGPCAVFAWAALPGPVANTDRRVADGLVISESRGLARTDADDLRRALEHPDPRNLSASISGDFAFVVAVAEDDLVAVRSCAGTAPMHVWAGRSLAAASTRLEWIIRFIDRRWRLDPLAAAILASGQGHVPDCRSPIAGVQSIPAGGLARVAVNRPPRIGRYWDPRPRDAGQLRRDPEHARRLRRHLLEAIEADLDPGGRNLLTLSGGVDSTTLLALAAHRDRATATLSVLPAPGASRERELSFIECARRNAGVAEAIEVTIDAEHLEQDVASPLGCVVPTPHPALREAARRPATAVLFGGEWADELCGSIFTLVDWCAHTPARSVFVPGAALPFGRRDRARWLKARVRGLSRRRSVPLVATPAAADPAVIEELTEWQQRWARAWRRDSGPQRGLALQLSLDAHVTMNWEVLAARGTRRSYPFVTRETIELAFGAHPADLVGPGTKRLLREAVDDLVPARNLYRADKGGWAHQSQLVLPPVSDLPPGLEGIVGARVVGTDSQSARRQAHLLAEAVRQIEAVRTGSARTA